LNHYTVSSRPPPPPEVYAPEVMDRVNRLSEKTRKLRDILQKLTVESEIKPKPVADRVQKDTLEQIIRKALSDKEIGIPFEYAIYSPSNDSNRFPVKSAEFNTLHLNTEHKVTLFPNDLIAKPNQLLLFFPGQKGQILSSLSWLMISSIIFTLIIVLSSGASIVVMIRQKKISDIKTDFINNMTHEFKTPIATISIAADSIVNSKVIQEPEKIRNFTRIIKEENNRMNTRVEQVLQMALLDSRDFKLKSVLTDLHGMILRAVDHYRLQIEKRDGTITTRLEASNAMVEVDEDHMRNVLMNLLDNANKYSGSRPDICVFTFNRGENFFFGVEDHGEGMSLETQRRVFDKFFRVTSGNIHNIKGFGLGLSYVKAIVLAHHGEISIQSEVGKGSRFEISLAYVPGQGEKVVYEGMKE
jgi:signal transduction histidine kinase